MFAPDPEVLQLAGGKASQNFVVLFREAIFLKPLMGLEVPHKQQNAVLSTLCFPKTVEPHPAATVTPDYEEYYPTATDDSLRPSVN